MDKPTTPKGCVVQPTALNGRCPTTCPTTKANGGEVNPDVALNGCSLDAYPTAKVNGGNEKRAHPGVPTHGTQPPQSEMQLQHTPAPTPQTLPPRQPLLNARRLIAPPPKNFVVKASTIESAGDGLFLNEDAEKDVMVARYSGKLINEEEMVAMADTAYVVRIKTGLYLDASSQAEWEGRLINDGAVSNRVVNVRLAADLRCNYCEVTGKHWIKVIATTDISAGQELFLSYGDDYWARRTAETNHGEPACTPPICQRPPRNEQRETHLRGLTTVWDHMIEHQDSITSKSGWLHSDTLEATLDILTEIYPATYFAQRWVWSMISTGNIANTGLWDLTGYTRIVFPMYRPGHWTVTVGCLRTRTLVHLDSLGGTNPAEVKKIKMFLDNLVNLPTVRGSPKFRACKNPVGTSRQRDGSSCGFFVLGWIEKLAQGTSITQIHKSIQQRDIRTVRAQIRQYLRHARWLGPNSEDNVVWCPNLQGVDPEQDTTSDSESDFNPDDTATESTEEVEEEPELSMGAISQLLQQAKATAERRAQENRNRRANRRRTRLTQGHTKHHVKPGGKTKSEDHGRAKMLPTGDGVPLMSVGRQTNTEVKVKVKIATWNVTSVKHTQVTVNSAGAVDSDRSRSIASILYIINQMLKHDIYVVCLQETRLENKVYRYDGGFVLVNHNTGNCQHKGVGILLSPAAYVAWRKTNCKRHFDGEGRSVMVELATQCNGIHWMIMSQYSPLSKYKHVVKKFYADTKEMLKAVRPNDMLTLGGDYNGVVGSSTGRGTEHQCIIGKQNPQLLTANGEKLLELCRQQGLSIPQTFLESGHGGEATWTGNKMIRARCKPRVYDYLICNQRHRRWYTSVTVMRNWRGIATPHFAVVATIESGQEISAMKRTAKRKAVKLADRKPRLRLHTLMGELNPNKKKKDSKSNSAVSGLPLRDSLCFIPVSRLDADAEANNRGSAPGFVMPDEPPPSRPQPTVERPNPAPTTPPSQAGTPSPVGPPSKRKPGADTLKPPTEPRKPAEDSTGDWTHENVDVSETVDRQTEHHAGPRREVTRHTRLSEDGPQKKTAIAEGESVLQIFRGYILENIKDIQDAVKLDELIREAGELVQDEAEAETKWTEEHREEIATLAQRAGEARTAWKESDERSTKDSETAQRYLQAKDKLAAALRKSLNDDLQDLATRLEEKSGKCGRQFYKYADRLRLYPKTGNWHTARGHVNDTEAHMKRSREHFAKLHSTQRRVDMTAVRESPKFHKAAQVDWTTPTRDEVESAIRTLKNNKSQDYVGVQPELLKAALKEPEVAERFYQLIKRIWEGDPPPKYWNEALLVPIYKGKGDYSSLDNWRGISIQPWARKVFMKCINTRLSEIVALCVSKGQAGFRPSRGCMDVTFAIRRIMEIYRANERRRGRCRERLAPTVRRLLQGVRHGALGAALVPPTGEVQGASRHREHPAQAAHGIHGESNLRGTAGLGSVCSASGSTTRGNHIPSVMEPISKFGSRNLEVPAAAHGRS